MRKGTKMALKHEGNIMIALRSTLSSTNRHESGPETRFQQPYYPNISFLIRAAFRAGE